MTDYLVKMLKWEKRTSWDDILAPHGWEFPRLYASCRCAYVTRPIGDLFPSTPKSAIIHREGCLHRDIDDLGLHILSPHVSLLLANMMDDARRRGELPIFGKFEMYTALNFDGDKDTALKSIGISPTTSSAYDDHDLVVVGKGE